MEAYKIRNSSGSLFIILMVLLAVLSILATSVIRMKVYSQESVYERARGLAYYYTAESLVLYGIAHCKKELEMKNELPETVTTVYDGPYRKQMSEKLHGISTVVKINNRIHIYGKVYKNKKEVASQECKADLLNGTLSVISWKI